KAVYFRFTNYVCKSYNESWFRFNNCRLKAISREKVVLNLNATVLHSVNNVHVKLKMYKRANGFKPWLIDLNIDICRYLRKAYNPFVKLVYSFVKEFSNLNHTCPYIGAILVQGLYLKPELLILPFPTGEYLLTMRWSFDQRLQFDNNATFMFIEDLRNS
ncbi:hypothetical protein KR032_002376, partial [Drosophila birchii]